MVYRAGTKMNLRVDVPSRKLAGGSVQEHIWTTLRKQKCGTTEELAFWASTDTLAIREDQVDLYMRQLQAAGIVRIDHDPVERRKAWTLVPRGNSGPLPPMLMQISLVFDRNSSRVVDGPHTAELVL